MSRRHDITPRTFSAEGALGLELERFAASIQEALDLVPLVSFRWVRGYVATAAGDAMPPIEWPGDSVAGSETAGPDVAYVVRAYDRSAPSGDVGDVGGRTNFKYDSGNVTLYEPASLTADSTYDLVVMFVGGV